MRRASRRSFTVEVKAAGRHHATTIPSRVAAPVAVRPPLFSAPPPEPPAPAIEKRRVLPTLIAPEPLWGEPEPASAAAEPQPPRKRGRPRKPRPVAAEPIVQAATVPVPAAPAPARPHETVSQRGAMPAPRRLEAGPTPDLARGERWKRRLRGWSR